MVDVAAMIAERQREDGACWLCRAIILLMFRTLVYVAIETDFDHGVGIVPGARLIEPVLKDSDVGRYPPHAYPWPMCRPPTRSEYVLR
jgi:hypothetical protein